MARDEDLSLAVLLGVGPSPIGLYQPSVFGRWFYAYSRCGHTNAQYYGINAVFDSSQKDPWTMRSNRLAVFAASLQWADVEPRSCRGEPLVSDVGDLGSLVVGGFLQ